jgi:hypothetical protein
MPLHLPHITDHGIIIETGKYMENLLHANIFYLKKNIFYQSESLIAPPKSIFCICNDIALPNVENEAFTT